MGSSQSQCEAGFFFHRIEGMDGEEDKCFCRKGDGLDPTPKRLTIDPEDLKKFLACLTANQHGPLRCIALMEALGYSFDIYGSWMPPTSSPSPNSNNDDDESTLGAKKYVLNPCPKDDANACRDGYFFQKLIIDGQEECSCNQLPTTPRFEVNPCPDPSTPPSDICPPNHHLETTTTTHNSTTAALKCFCVRDTYILDPCPAVDSDDLCDAGFRFVREHQDEGAEVCKCQRAGWEIVPCPSQERDCGGLCPVPYVFEREATPVGMKCACADPGSKQQAGSKYWHGGCEHCHYGNGKCTYDSRRGWFCKCINPSDGGPDCIVAN